MADVLLVHGSCHGAWCWELVTPLLAALGHNVRAIDLPGHGDDTTPVAEVTLDAYARAVAEACRTNTHVVGHSMGGYAISAAATLAPERIAQLIYLCAYVPCEGMTLAEMRMQAPTQPLLPAVRMREDRQSFVIDPTMAKDIFYHDCDPDIAHPAIARLCAQAVAPTNLAVAETKAQAALPRHYIRCMDDRTIPPEFQVTMTKDWPRAEVQEMMCGHSPFLSDPEELATRLDRAIRGCDARQSL